MKQLRVFFEKTGRAAYISHLDLSRTMQRALKRASLPVWYTEGFNPHIYITFALPLSLGYEGLSESFDLLLVGEVEPEQLVSRLNACLPGGLRVTSAAEPQMKPDKIVFAQYSVMLDVKGIDNLQQAMADFLAQPGIEVEKTTKKGKSVIDIKPDIKIDDIKTNENTVCMLMTLPAGSSKNLNPSLVIAGIEGFIGRSIAAAGVTRRALYDQNMQRFA